MEDSPNAALEKNMFGLILTPKEEEKFQEKQSPRKNPSQNKKSTIWNK